MTEVLGLLGAAVLAVIGAWFAGQRKGRRDEHRDAISEAMRDEKERLQKGRDAVRDGRGSDPDERLRDNDGRW
ncbi:MAG: hypothetical protein FKY71_19790 [Spiribacter salinus]|uniref:Uncharacterized protein n=1 Tax=Spiribacter salinus TaxID=1335746 RepID=A0A540V717_9GAMM|nr:MAG: hypothetical protein FKY71_19790 [Spiribacter salinus]